MVEKTILDFVLNNTVGALSFLMLPYLALFYVLYSLKKSIDQNTDSIQSLVILALRNDPNVDNDNYVVRKLLKKED